MEGNKILHRVTDTVERHCDGPDNRLWPDSPEPAWAKPRVGLCRADDAVFMRFKEVVGPFHWTPQEAYHLAYPETQVESKNLAVVVWILPQTEKTKQDNRREKFLPAERWARSRIFGESFNNKLRERVAKELTEQGFPAVAPMLLSGYESRESDRYIFASTWSERHMAYAAGLGTFGLCDGLITPVGKAMRVGSVVAKMPVPAIKRPYENHYDYCLFLSQATCGRCIERCPVNAISQKGHDKIKCREYLESRTRPYVTQKLGFEGYGCGLCQTDVPCESAIPER